MKRGEPALYRVSEAATVLSVSEWEVRRLVHAGILERRYIGQGRRFFRITAASLEDYLDSLEP